MSRLVEENIEIVGCTRCTPKSGNEIMLNEPANLPLTDGTNALVTEYALMLLDEDYGIVRGRIKKGSAGEVVVVAPKRFDGKRVIGNKEVPLRDLLAIDVYGLCKRLERADISGYRLADGNPRNLMPSNVVKVLKSPPDLKDRKPYTRRKPLAVTERPTDALHIHEQESLLSEAFPKMRGVAYAILKSDCQSQTGSSWQADDVVQKVALNLLSLIRAGKCKAANRGQFFSFCFALTQREASWKLQALSNGTCRDVDHDEAEILLLRVRRLEGDLRERQGLPVDYGDSSPLDGMDPAWVAKELERDAEKKAAEEKQRVKEEGGKWNRVDLEAGTEVLPEIEPEPLAVSEEKDDEDPTFLPDLQEPTYHSLLPELDVSDEDETLAA
jgi:hypothetical protein